MRFIHRYSIPDIRVLPFLTVLLIGAFIFFTMPTAHAASLYRVSSHPNVSGCSSWVVAEQTDGTITVDLEEDYCGGYYAVVYFYNLSYSDFHVYVQGAVSKTGYCINASSCITDYAGFTANNQNKVCYFGEGGPAYGTYTNHVAGCVTP